MSDLFGNHIVGFPTRRLKSSTGRVGTSIVGQQIPKITMWQILAFIDKSKVKNGKKMELYYLLNYTSIFLLDTCIHNVYSSIYRMFCVNRHKQNITSFLTVKIKMY